MSYSDNDDFEKDPFEQDGFESDPSSENGKSEDSGKSDSSPSFDDFLNEFGAFGSDSQLDPDFSAFENGGETPSGQDDSGSGADETSFDDLLNSSSGTPAEKDDTLAGLAGLEDMLGGNQESEPESPAEPSAELTGEGEGELGLDSDFFGAFNSTENAETPAESETPKPAGDFSLDDLNISDADAGKDDTLAGLAGLEGMLGGNQESEPESGAEPSAELTGEGEGELGLDSDFFGAFSGTENSETPAESGTPEPAGDFSLDDLNLSDADAGKDDTLAGLAGLEDMLGGSEEGADGPAEPSAELTGEGEGELGLDSDFFGSIDSAESGETPAEPETPEPAGDFSLDDLNLSDADAGKDDTLAGLAGLEGMLGGSQEGADGPAEPSAELTGEGEGELGLDSDFFGTFNGSENTETPAEPETPEPAGDFSLDDLNLSDADAGKDDTLSGLAGLEDVLGGNQESEPDGGSEPSAELTSEGEGELGLGSDFFGSFSGTENSETPAESETPEPAGDFSLDDLNLSDADAEPAAPSEGEESSLDDLLGGDSASDTGSPDQFGAFPSEPADAENTDPFSALNTGEEKGADTTMSGLAGLEAALGGGTGADEDTASRLAGLTADGGDDGALDSDFLGSFAGSDASAGEEETPAGETSSETAAFDPDFIGGFGDDSLQASEEAPTEEESPSFDSDDAGPDPDFLSDSAENEPAALPEASDESDPFAVLNTGKEPEGESTTAALAGLEGLAGSGGKSEGDVGEDTLARLGFLSTDSEPEQDQSTTAALAGLSGLSGLGGDSEGEDTAVRLAHMTEDEEEEDESPDERTLDDLVGGGEETDSFADLGGTGPGEFDEFGSGSFDGFGGGTDGFSETREPGDTEEAEEAGEDADGTDPKKKKRKAKKEKGKKEPKEPKKKRSYRRKKEDTDPVSRLLKIPTVFFLLYLILGNVKGLLAAFKPANAFETFCTPFFLIAFNATGLVLFLLPALLRAFRKRYAEDPKLTEYTLFMFMMAAAVAALIFACHPLIFDLARNWGKPM